METYAIYRAPRRLGTGAAWGPAEQRVWRYLAARPLPGKAGPPGYRERRGAGGLLDHFPNDLIPIPGTSQALQVRLCLWAILGEEILPLGFLSSSSNGLQRVNRCAVERGTGRLDLDSGWETGSRKVRFDWDEEVEFRVMEGWAPSSIPSLKRAPPTSLQDQKILSIPTPTPPARLGAGPTIMPH